MKRIAYIRSSNIYDDSRATKEINALLENGYHVLILGWNRDGKAYDQTKDVFKKYSDNVDIYFFNHTMKNGIGIKNINILFKWIKWTKGIIKRIDNLDYIHMCNLDCALGYYHHCKKSKIKIIYDIYDYYVDSHNIPSVIKKIVEQLEINVINRADVTIICTEERKQQIIKAKPKKLIVIHNSPDVEKQKKSKIEYDYVYCGVLGEHRLIKEIFDGYNENSDLKFAIAGYGNYSEKAKELSKKYDNFKYFGPLKYEEVLKLESKGMLISAIYEPTIRNHKLCAPNKFYEAMGLGKPVVVCKETGIDLIVEDNDIGKVINYNCDEFFKALRELKENKKKCSEIALKTRGLYEKKYKWEIMKERLLKIYEGE